MLFGDFAESRSKDLRDTIDEEEFAEDHGYLSDSDLEDDDYEGFSSSKHTTESEVQPFDPFAASGEEKIGCECHTERIEKGKVVKIPDMAFVTWVIICDPFSASFTSSQIPSFFDISLHGPDRICTIWIGRESQTSKRRSLQLRQHIPSTVPEVYLPTCR